MGNDALPPDERHASALAAWREVLGTARVLGPDQARARYPQDTSGTRRALAGALLPGTVAEVQEAVRLAQRHAIPLYPISTGNNWGYGGAHPVRDGCMVLDLSGLRAIRRLDPELATVTVEPGVTQAQLRAHLDRHQLPFMVPATGAGPRCSLLGNALERGYGLTPYADHFGAVTSLEAVLADGSLYRPALAEMGAPDVDEVFKWGIGPYLDGLFTQGAFGVVTAGTIALARRPERVESFFFELRDESHLPAAVAAVRAILTDLEGVTGSINLMNRRRVVSMVEPFPAAEVPPRQAVPEEVVARLARRQRLPAWLGVGALYGTAAVVRAARARVRRHLRGVPTRALFLNRGRLGPLRGLSRLIPGALGEGARARLESLALGLEILEGIPNEVALPLACWRAGRAGAPGAQDPARDGCGVLWYSPLVPMRPETVADYAGMVTRVALEHGIDPLITLTSLSARCFDSTVPLLFDRADALHGDQARRCFAALFQAGRDRGLLPYRLGVEEMDRFARLAPGAGALAARLRAALDPGDILSPGRYTGTAPRQGHEAGERRDDPGATLPSPAIRGDNSDDR
jgi:FAD/FMN-containing dehydrogenase